MPRTPKAKSEDAEVDQKPYLATLTKKKTANSEQGSPSKNGGKGVPWTPEENWRLFCALYVKRDAPNWDEVAKAVGRDKKVRLLCRPHDIRFPPNANAIAQFEFSPASTGEHDEP
jgi:hypothetical protein